jgi:hypothetical protein
MTEYVPVFPSKDDPLFVEKLAMMDDFGIFKIPPQEVMNTPEEFKKNAETLCSFEKTYYQHFVSQYISRRSPYKGLLLYHGLGSGKTCSAITIAETFLKDHRMYHEPTVWVVSKKALEQSFEQEVFRTILLTSPEFIREQCTGDSYYSMIPDNNTLTNKQRIKRIHKIIKSRYKFVGYEKFANLIEEGLQLKNKIIIIDEAHNIRNTSEKEQKKIIKPILKFIKEPNNNNKLVLLSATPMFNEAEEILWLTGLLMLNDGENPPFDILNIPTFYNQNNTPKPEMFKIIKNIASQYISYIRGSNPFTFAVRVHPSLLNIPILKQVPKLTFKGDKIPENELQWLDAIKDGLVPSELSGIQLQHLKELQKLNPQTDETDEKQQGIARLRQINNITYIKKLTKTAQEFVEGKDGFTSIFKKNENTNQFEYIDPTDPILDPAYGKLKDYSTKFQTIYELLQKSKGLVVIYSNFVWGGVMPLAVMLEHSGLSRFGEKDILNMKYKPKNGSMYCILSGESDKDVMGSSKIDTLLNDINNPLKNKHLKVVLMTPVASEGLTFKAVREMHILDAWYHMNTAEQAIGRAIRHCSHSSLPIEERNVSVFLHTTIFPDNKYETEDLHAYRLAAFKHSQIMSVDKVIKENAIDCGLMKNVNSFPKELFDFTTVLKTSQDTSIVYKYGDTEEAPKCSSHQKLPKERRAFRKESYENFIPTLQLKLQKFLKESSVREYTYEELIDIIHENKEVAHQTLEASLYPYKLWGNYSILYHYNKFIITEFKKENLRPTRIQISEDTVPFEKKTEPDYTSKFETLLEKFSLESIEMATLQLYKAIDSNIWNEFARKIITTKPISPSIQKCIDILESNGSFIRNNELPKFVNPNNNYVGYLNIFSEEETIEGFVWDTDGFRELAPSEILKIKKERTSTPFPDPMKNIIKTTQGTIQRYKNPKIPDSPYIFQYKLLLNNEGKKRKGIVCETGLKKPAILKELDLEKSSENISQLCFKLMYKLLKANKLWIPVSYK